MVLQGRIELPTSSLPMTRSTTELLQQRDGGGIDAKRQACKPLFVTLWTVGAGCAMGKPMRDTDDSDPAAKPRKSASEAAREARLKLALKANMGRRKAQTSARAQARSEGPGDNDKSGLDDKPQENE